MEVQLHLRELHAQKHEMHVIYNSIRVLGAFDPVVIAHYGQVNDQAIELAARGIVRKLVVPYCTMLPQQMRDIINLLHQDGCTLLTLDVSNAELDMDNEREAVEEAFKGKALVDLFKDPSHKQMVEQGAVAPLIAMLMMNHEETRGFAAACLSAVCADPNAHAAIIGAGGKEPLLALAQSGMPPPRTSIGAWRICACHTSTQLHSPPCQPLAAATGFWCAAPSTTRRASAVHTVLSSNPRSAADPCARSCPLTLATSALG